MSCGFLFCFLNSENGRVEREDRKDCFQHRDTCCCLFAWLQFREPGLHALYRQQPLAPHSPTVWGMTLASSFTDEEREAQELHPLLGNTLLQSKDSDTGTETSQPHCSSVPY